MKKMNKGMLMAALICGVVQWGGTPVHASELQEFALDEYVVTAARTETKLVDTPANISVVDAQTIEERHYQDVSEVLKDVPGANVMDTGHGASEKVIKLNGDERVLILVDGRRVNIDMGTMSRAGFDMNLLPDVGIIERVEILKGAGGALYGSDAVGGVVNIITKKANRNFGKVSIAMGSMGAKDYSAMYSIKEGKTGVTLTASKNEQDYYKYRDYKTDTTKRWPGNSKFENEKVSLKLEQEITFDSNLVIGYDYNKFEGFSSTDIDAKWGVTHLDKKYENLYAKYDWTLSDEDMGYVQIYRNKLEYNNQGYMEEESYGIELQQEITLNETNKLVAGFSYRDSEAMNEWTYFNGADINNTAVFISNTWEFAPTWTLNAGVRYDDHSEAGDETTLSAGLNKKFSDDSHAYINWGQVFKAPTIDDLYYSNSSMGQGNSNLNPETGDTWTIGYQTKLNKKTGLGFSYFESDLEDAIDWDTSSNPAFVRNIAKQDKRGVEITLDHSLSDNVDLVASYSYIRVKNNNADGNGFVRDANYIPNTYRLGIRYNEGKWNASAWLRNGSGASTSDSLHYSYGFPYYAPSYVDNGYWTMDIAVTYKATKDLSFYAKGYNLFNEAYAEFAGVTSGSYSYPAQSRRFIVGAEYKF